MQRVDSHCHFWTLSRGDYSWLDVDNPALAPIARDFCFSDLAPSVTALGIEKLILVQAAATEAETDFLLSLADAHSEIEGVVGWADIESHRAVETLSRWAQHAKFKGIRPMLQDIEATDWLMSKPQPDVWNTLVDLGLRFDALVQPRHLKLLHQFCQQNEALPVVIDHVAKPKQAFSGDLQAFSDWADDMHRIGRDTQAYCKISGVVTEFAKSDMHNAMPVVVKAIDHLLECFGASRLMWGSDWPVLTLQSDYQSWNDLTLLLLDDLSQDEKAMVFGGSATQFYGLGEAV